MKPRRLHRRVAFLCVVGGKNVGGEEVLVCVQWRKGQRKKQQMSQNSTTTAASGTSGSEGKEAFPFPLFPSFFPLSFLSTHAATREGSLVVWAVIVACIVGVALIVALILLFCFLRNRVPHKVMRAFVFVSFFPLFFFLFRAVTAI